MHFGTFILDFQSINFESDARIVTNILKRYLISCRLNPNESDNFFALDHPVSTAGWSFSKLFLASQFVENLHMIYSDEINTMKGKKYEEKFVFWLTRRLKNSNCGAQIRIASEMKL
jgi:hypothetical protein